MNVVFKIICIILYVFVYLFISIFNHEIGHVIGCKTTEGEVTKFNMGFTQFYPTIEYKGIYKHNPQYIAYITCRNSNDINFVKMSGVIFTALLTIIALPLINKYIKYGRYLFLLYNPEFFLYSLKLFPKRKVLLLFFFL